MKCLYVLYEVLYLYGILQNIIHHRAHKILSNPKFFKHSSIESSKHRFLILHKKANKPIHDIVFVIRSIFKAIDCEFR